MKIFTNFCIVLCVVMSGTVFAGSATPHQKLIEEKAAGIASYKLANGFKIILIPYPSAANARIRDTDVAQASADMARNSVLLQANTAVLAQANSIPQMALKLV